MTDAPPAPPDDLRGQLLARFGAWLDEALAEEAPPEGLAAELLAGAPAEGERACDLFALWSAMTALTQEVKLQGRTFHALEQALRALPGGVEALRQATERALEDRRRAEEERAFAATLELLLDLRERLRRGLGEARAHARRVEERPAPGRLARLLGAARPSGAEAERALARGYELALERLDDALRERGVRELECEGRAFDPHRMRAVDLAAAPGRADGTVLEVLRAGYERRGELVRPAEVRVARGGAA